MTRNRDLDYLSGFGNFHETEALKGVLPEGQNAPQKVAKGLYAEQLSGTSFLATRYENKRSWLYRILPSAGLQSRFERRASGKFLTSPLPGGIMDPNQMRWDPIAIPEQPVDFLDSLVTFAANGDAGAGTGTTIHHYACNRSMEDRFFYNSDGEMLIVPQTGELRLRTEFGCLEVDTGEIAVIPRGVKFTIDLLDKSARGYVCENHGAMLRLPDLGPIGSNGLANPRDFLAPVAEFEDTTGDFELVAKFQGELWTSEIHRSPLDVVGWHGNLYPYKYDLDRFNTIGTVSFDHPDPSIFTVLTSPSDTPGVSNIDFVIFPPRWMVAQETFRPPYYHRNIMSEYMGLIEGKYDAKPEGFVPGGASLHNCMSAHGPDRETFDKASSAELKPEYYANTLAFMFESRYPYSVSRFAYDTPLRQRDYVDCWKGLRSQFKP